jgi:uncharacterized integral membrane protein
MKPKVIAVIVAAVILLILILLNLNSVTTRIFWLRVEMPLALLLAIVAAIAYMAGVITDGKVFRRPKGPPYHDKDDKKD